MHALEEILGEASSREELRRSLQPPYAAPLVRCAKIKVTPRCNLRCTFCRYWRLRASGALSTAALCRILDELAEAGCAKVHFSGGEPLLREDLPSLLAHATRLGMKANLTTNGTLLDGERARALVEAGAHSVSFSLDGPDARTHDSLRGVSGAFRQTLRGIRALTKARDRAGSRLQLRLNVVLTRHNYRRLPEIIALAWELGMAEVHPMPVDDRVDDPSHCLGEKEIAHFNTCVVPLAADMRRRAGFSLAPHLLTPFGTTEADAAECARGHYARGYYESHLCYAPWLHLFLTWNGDAYLCCMARGKTPPLGNARECSVRALFNGEAYRAMRQQFVRERPKICRRCDMFLPENRLIESSLRAG